jgi:hypothetical protein
METPVAFRVLSPLSNCLDSLTRRIQLTQSVVLALSLLAAVLAVALLRERRLRLALEALVLKLA